MNEFTNPAGNSRLLETAEFPAIFSESNPFSSFPKKDEIESSYGFRMNNSRNPQPSLLSQIIVPDEKRQIIRKAAADIMNSQLIMVQIMLASMMHTYIHAVTSELINKGKLRHNTKRRCTELTEQSQALIDKCEIHDKIQVRVYTSSIYPSLTESFIENGGTLSQKVQCLFYKRYGNLLNSIYSATKNAVDKCNISNSEIISNAEMVIMICNSGIDFRNYIEKHVKGLMICIGNIKSVRDKHNEKIACAAKDLVREMCGNIPVPEDDMNEVRHLTEQFNKQLVTGELLDTVKSAILSLQMDFVEFIIVTLRIKLARNKMSINDYRTLFHRLGTRNNVENLLKEIREIPYEDCENPDIPELMESLPDTKQDSVLSEFRRLCVEDHVFLNPETNKERYLRHFRQKVYRGNGCLDMQTLRYLYNVFGTKKAMIDYLSQAGMEVMGNTIRRIKRIKASELSFDAKKKYALNVGEGMKTMYLKHGYTREQFAIRAKVTKEYILEIERTGDLSRAPYIMGKLYPMITSISNILCEEPRFILFNSLIETEKGGLPPEAYTSLFREMEKVYNDNNYKSKEDGKEEKKE